MLLYSLVAMLAALLGISLGGYALAILCGACRQTLRDAASSVRGWRERA